MLSCHLYFPNANELKCLDYELFDVVRDAPKYTYTCKSLVCVPSNHPFCDGVTREIHPLDPQPHRYCMLASTASAPRVTRCSPGAYWSRDLCSKHALAGWGMSSYLGQIVGGSEI